MRIGSATIDRFAHSRLAFLPSLLLLGAVGLLLCAAPAHAQTSEMPGGGSSSTAAPAPGGSRTVPSRDAARLIQSLTQSQAIDMLRRMDPGDAAAVLRNLQPSAAASLLNSLSLPQATDIMGRLNQLSSGSANAIRNALPAGPLRTALAPPGALASALGGGATTGSGAYYVDGDNSYKNTELMCDLNTVYASCPPRPMPMKDTAKKSLIKDFTPYLFAYARNPDDRSRPYTGTYYRGTPGEATQTFQLFGKPGRGDKGADACVAQIHFPAAAGSVAEEAKIVRLELDNCTNQFVLYSSLYPYQKEGSGAESPTLLSGENPANAAERISLASHCQPLRTVPENRNEYFASDYLKAAWIKLLQDPTYRKNPRAPAEPHLPDGVRIDNPIAPPSPFPDVRLSAIAAVPFEEINDPSHPYSPRWDYEFNERDHYSPMTASYSNDPQNAVFCAGDKSSQVLKVDILSFREATLHFDDKITKRIDFNKNCKANTGMQKDPCCIPQGPGGQVCKLIPCAQCYAMTAESPVCSTNYVGTPDRKKVVVPYLPVHPALRVANALQSMSSLSLTNLNSVTGGVMTVAQTRALLSSNLAILSSFGINTPLSQVMPMLNGQLSMLTSLPNLSPQMLTNALGGQINLIKSLTDLPMPQIQSLLNGHLASLSAFSNITGLPLNSALAAVQSPQYLLNGLMAQTPLADARTFLNQNLAVANNLVRQGVNVGNAANQIAGQLGQLSSFNAETTLAQAMKVGLNTAGLQGLPTTMTVGQLRTVLNSQAIGLAGFNPTATLNQYAALANSTTNAINAMSGSLTAGQVGTMLNSVQGSLRVLGNTSGLLDMGNLGQMTSALNGSITGIRNLSNSITNATQLASMLGGNNALAGMLGPNMNMNQLTSALSGQLRGLGNISGIMNVGQLSGMYSSQLAGLSGIAGNVPLSSVAGQLDTSMFGGIPGVNGAIPGMPSGPSPSGTLPTAAVLAAMPGMGPDPRTSKCNPNELGETNSVAMASLCRDLRAPFTPLNKLKMRYHNPAEQNSITLKEGVPEGYTFKEYFGKNMPYPKLWDTGRSIQRTESDQQDPHDEMGQYTAIVGVGHEGDPGNSGSDDGGDSRASQAEALKKQDQRCLYGGWGDAPSMGGAHIALPDPIASWTELKLYQTRTRRDLQISCLARYEKSFKKGSAENMSLSGSGAKYDRGIISTKDASGKVTFKSQAEFQESGMAPDAQQTSQLKGEAWPLAWRGYMSSLKERWRFPNFPTQGSNIKTGLDNAEVGDIILLPRGMAKDGDKPGLPKVARVEKTNLPGSSDCMSRNPPNCFIYVLEGDNGKWPDVCGTTDTWGEMKFRSIYKPGMLPQDAKEEYQHVGVAADCSDTHVSYCEAPDWDQMKLYRVRQDVREGNSGGTP